MRAGAIGVVEIGNATLNGELVLDSSDNRSRSAMWRVRVCRQERTVLLCSVAVAIVIVRRESRTKWNGYQVVESDQKPWTEAGVR